MVDLTGFNDPNICLGLCQFSTHWYRQTQKIHIKTRARDDECAIVLECSIGLDPALPYHLILYLTSTFHINFPDISSLNAIERGWILKSHLHNCLPLFFHLSLNTWYFRKHLHRWWVSRSDYLVLPSTWKHYLEFKDCVISSSFQSG